jgi:hypothetical protein
MSCVKWWEQCQIEHVVHVSAQNGDWNLMLELHVLPQ